MRKTLVQTLGAAFCAILAHTSLAWMGLPSGALAEEGGGMTRRDFVKAGGAFAAALAAGDADAAFTRSMIGARESAMMAAAKPSPGGYWGLCFTAEEARSTIGMTTAVDPGPVLQTSRDGRTWSPFIPGVTTIVLDNVGDKVFFAAGPTGNTQMSTEDASSVFTMTGQIAASGDISSLLDRNNPVADLWDRDYCFAELFYSCDVLTTPPLLPATTLSPYCYSSLFEGCSSLVSAPELPATTLEVGCYVYMFGSCESLEAAPAWSANTLATSCCLSMFEGCSSLVSAPVLPAASLVGRCYSRMFYNCRSLASIRANFTDWGNTTTTQNWCTRVSSSGTFYCPSALPTGRRGASGIPSNWTIVNI